MNYFITGATGFIGSQLCLKLANDGHIIHALVRTPAKTEYIAHPNIRIFYGNIFDREILEEAIRGVDGIFHLTAYAKPWAKDPSVYNKINVEGTRLIYELAIKHSIPKVVFTSTAGTYGPSANTPVDEHSLRLVDFFNEYESTKFMAEKLTKDYVLKGQNIVIVHPTRVYGPGLLSKSNSVTIMIKNYIRGIWRIIPGSGEKIGNYAFIEDVVRGHILAMDKGLAGAQYFLGGENASYEEFFHILKQASYKKYVLIRIPVVLLKAFAAVQMTAARILGKPPLLPVKWVNKYMYNWAVSSEKASSELGYTITGLEQGIMQTIKWLNTKT